VRFFSDVTGLGVAFRFVHLLASLALVGAVVIPLVAGRTDRTTALAWQARMRRFALASIALAIVAGAASIAIFVVVLEGSPRALADHSVLARVLFDTRVGVVWLVRASLLLVLAAFLSLSLPITTRVDWIAARGEAALLGVLALALAAAASHAAAIEPGTARAIAVDATHLIAAGVWLGGLIPIARLLRAATRESGEDARAYAVLATRRYSTLALLSVFVLVLTGLTNAAMLVGNVPALVGTPYGRLLLWKLALVIALVAIGAVNRRRWLPALSGDAQTIGRPMMRRLVLFMTVESVLGALVLAIVAAMSSTPPAQHTDPTWPFDVRLSWDLAAALPSARARVLIASQIAVIGLVALLTALFVRRGRRALVAAGVALAIVGVSFALPPLVVDAYPTTFRRPATPYSATSIAAGLALYGTHCAGCHGAAGAGDGPDARSLPRAPTDLRSARVAQHTAGDVFWWISRGVAGTRMPAFASEMSEEERWDVVNALRALGAAQAAAALGPVVSESASVVAPDFSFAVGPATPQTLRGLRDRRVVLLVLYTLPQSLPRLGELAGADRLLSLLGVEIIAVPTDAAPDAIARVGPKPRALFSIVTSGAADIVRTYRLFTPGSHAEFLIDRQGYLRARWTPSGIPTREINRLLAEVQQLNEEQASAPPPDEHVH
jgi:putative copper export protein/mono/diheme cytochrome c family protein